LNTTAVRSFSKSLDPATPPAQDAPRYYQVQALRFYAAFAVVIGHAFIFTAQKFPVSPDIVELAGWAGGWSVALFFCVSGFVITHGAQRLDASQFLIHRLARIYPAYWLAVVVVCMVKFTLFHGLPTGELSLISATLLPAGERGYPLWIEWSLVYEVFFYTLFAVLWISRSNRALLVFVTLWLLVIAGVALMRPGWASARYPTAGQIFFSARNLPFIFGVYCYFLRPHFSPSIRAILLLLFPAGLAGIVAVPGDLKILAESIAAFGLLGYLASAQSAMKRDALLVKLGDFSYGIYLIHISAITILLSVGFKEYQNPWLAIAAVTAAGTACGAIFGFVELAMYKRIKSFLDQRFGVRRVVPALAQADVPG
jgi:exopolysaccharide production protein ExoZ